MVVKEKIDIDKLSLEELQKLKDDIENERRSCKGKSCCDCLCDSNNFVGDILNCVCVKLEVEKRLNDAKKRNQENTKIDIDKLSLEELTELYKNCIRDAENCAKGSMQCRDCSLSMKNYVCEFKVKSCYFVAVRILERISEIYKKEVHENSKCQEVNCKCSECSYLNKELLDNGYCFCYHWHNFTKPDGFCSFGKREKRPVDNSEISCETNT